MDKQERYEFHRFCDEASLRQLRQERIDIEHALDVLPHGSAEYVDVKFMERVVNEELQARQILEERRAARFQRRA